MTSHEPVDQAAVILFLAASFLAVPTGAEETRRKVVARSPTQQQLTRHLLSTGTFRAVSSAELAAGVSGTPEEIRFRYYDGARMGEVIFVIEPMKSGGTSWHAA